MAILKFFKVPRHQRFGYIPRYWDPDKEELQERVRRAEQAGTGDTEAVKARLSTGFRNRAGYTPRGRARSQQTFRSNMILLIVIAGLIVVSYVVIQVYLPKIIQYLE